MKMKFLLLFFAIFILNECAAQKHNGYVYLDNNQNGIFDSGDKKLKGVAVSDGLNVVLTNADGKFTLPGHSKERFVHITLPSQYSANKHYIAIPSNEYVFGLSAYENRVSKNDSHKFIHLADTEISETQTNERWAADVRDYARNEKAAFIIHTGDICYPAGLKSHIKLMNTENMNCKVFYGIGNHDLVKGAYGEEMFESIYGPVYYSFEAGNVHYIVTPMLGGDYKPSYTRTDVYEWLKNDLANVPDGKPIIIFSHDLLTGGNEFTYGSKTEFVDLNKHNLKAWLYGHWHIHHIKKQGTVHSIGTSTPDKGGIDHSVSAFRVMHIDSKGDFTSELRYTYTNKLLSIVYPPSGSQVPLTQYGKIPLSVNTYNTVSPVTEASYTLAANDKIIGKGKLTKNTDWNFSTELDVATRNNNKPLLVTVKVVFGNGENAESTSVFEWTNKALVINASGAWTDLLGNPSHRGFTTDTLKTPLQPMWVANAGSNLYMASPLIANGMVYVATVDENYTGKAGICAFDVTTGKEVWRFKTRNSIKNSITAANGKVFAQDTEGYLYAVDGKSGSKIWEKKMNVAWLPAVVEGITSANGIVYAGTGKGLCAVNANTGETLWENTAWGQREGATTTITYSDNRIFSGAQWGGVYANDATTGKMLWSNGKDGLSDRGSSAVAINGTLYLISRSSLFVLDATTGKTIIRKDLPFKVDVTSTPLVTDDRIIFGSQSGLISLTTSTLETEWTFDTGEAVVYTGPYTRKGSRTVETSPVLSGNTVFFGASDGNFYAVSATDGKLQWKHATGAPIFSSPACSGNVLVFTDYGGNIYAFASDL